MEGRRGQVVAFVVHALLIAPVAYAALYRPETMFPNLWRWHAARIPETFRDPLSPIQPHFGWAGLGRLFDLVLPGDARVAGAVVSTLAAGAFGLVLYHVLRTDDAGRRLLAPGAALAVSVVLALLESPAAIQGWDAVVEPSTSFLPLYYPFVPTTFAAMGPNLLVLWWSGQLVRGRLAPAARRWLPVAVVVAAVAKPNLVPSLALVAPALALLLRTRPGSPDDAEADDAEPDDGADATDRASTVRDALALVTLPGAVVSAVQFAILVWASPPALTGGLEVRPFHELRALGGLGWQFWAILLFPLVAVVLLRGRVLSDPWVGLGLGALVLGVGASILFGRTGETGYQGGNGGDVVQLPSVAAAVLVIFIVRRWVILRRRHLVGTATTVVLLAALAPYVIGGAATYRCFSGMAECFPDQVPAVWPQPGIDDPLNRQWAEGP